MGELVHGHEAVEGFASRRLICQLCEELLAMSESIRTHGLVLRLLEIRILQVLGKACERRQDAVNTEGASEAKLLRLESPTYACITASFRPGSVYPTAVRPGA